jgi:PAT family beta-lactamase induction signal transducer AmpG
MLLVSHPSSSPRNIARRRLDAAAARVYASATLPNALQSRRVQLLGLLSVSSGMPLGFCLQSMQNFLRGAGVDLRTIGFAQAVSMPWSVKFLWSPLVDRFAARWPDRRRSWVVATQLGLAGALGALAAYASLVLVVDPATGRERLPPGAVLPIVGLVLAMVFVSATQDIALDAYAVEILEPEEQAPASGLRVFWYRIGMLLSGALAIFASQWIRWPYVFAGLAAVFLAFVGVTLAAEAPARPAAPPRSLAAAVWDPLASYFRRDHALLAALFLVLYKFGDNVGGSMINPLVMDLCFSQAEIGLIQKVIGTVGALAGAAAGAALMVRMGLGRALWIFGVLQAAGNLLFALAAATHAGPFDVARCGGVEVAAATRAAFYAATAGEAAFQGMATAAQGAFILKLCEKRFSATQFALLSSLFGLGRTLSGPVAGFVAQGFGYVALFGVATAAAIPGLLLLQRIAPLRQREVLRAPLPASD